jgi:hypothetical protein
VQLPCFPSSGLCKRDLQHAQHMTFVMKQVGVTNKLEHDFAEEGCYKGHASNYIATDPSRGHATDAERGRPYKLHPSKSLSPTQCVSADSA